MPHYEPSENLLFVENVNLSQHFSPQQIHWGRFLLRQWPRSKAEAQVVQARVEGSRGRCGAHPSWRFKGKVSHQSCLKVSLIQAMKRDIFISPGLAGLLGLAVVPEAPRAQSRPGAPTPKLIPEPPRGLSICRGVMGREIPLTTSSAW